MRAGGQPRHADVPYHLALYYMLSFLHCPPAHVQVLSSISAIVFYFHIIAIKAGISRCNYYPTAGCMNRRACRSSIIGAQVCFPSFFNRVKTMQAVMRCNPAKLKRRFQEGLTQAFSFFIKKFAPGSTVGFKVKGFIHFAAGGEFCRPDGA